MPGCDLTIGCLVPGCGRIAWARGVCVRHFHRHRKAVRLGETTWAALEAAGLVRPSQNANGPNAAVRREVKALWMAKLARRRR